MNVNCGRKEQQFKYEVGKQKEAQQAAAIKVLRCTILCACKERIRAQGRTDGRTGMKRALAGAAGWGMVAGGGNRIRMRNGVE